MKTYYLILLYGGIFNTAYTTQSANYNSMAQKSLTYFKEFYSSLGTTFDICIFGDFVYFLNDDNTWSIDEEADFPRDKFEIIVFESEKITEIGSIDEAALTDKLRYNVPYTSVWDGSTVFETSATVNVETGEITNIVTVPVCNVRIYTCDEEYITLDGKKVAVHQDMCGFDYWADLHNLFPDRLGEAVA